jgi:hypothetical protein
VNTPGTVTVEVSIRRTGNPVTRELIHLWEGDAFQADYNVTLRQAVEQVVFLLSHYCRTGQWPACTMQTHFFVKEVHPREVVADPKP